MCEPSQTRKTNKENQRKVTTNKEATEKETTINKTKENYREDNEKLPTITRGSVRPQHI